MLKNLVLGPKKFLGINKSNGIKVFEQTAITGERVLKSYKPNFKNPKVVIIYPKEQKPLLQGGLGFDGITTFQDVWVKNFGEDQGYFIKSSHDICTFNNEPYVRNDYLHNEKTGLTVIRDFFLDPIKALAEKKQSNIFLVRGKFGKGVTYKIADDKKIIR